jgi:type VI secretion system protein VasD
MIKRQATLTQGIGIALLFALAITAGCGGKAAPIKVDMPKLPEAPPPTELLIDVTATTRLNIGPGGDSAPLMVRFYELTDSGGFMSADYFRLLNDDRSALAGDLVAKEQVSFRPGQTRTITKNLNPTTRYVGIFAAYRTTDGTIWKAVAPITSATKNLFRCRLGPTGLTLTPGE